MVDPVVEAGVADTLEARLADARRRHEAAEYGSTLPLGIIELGIRAQWATEHPSRPASPRPVRNKGGVDEEVDGGARVSDSEGTKERGVIKVDSGVDGSQARVQRSTAAAGSSRADVDERRRSPLRSGGGLSATTHVTAGGIAPAYGHFKFTPNKITASPLQGRRDLITWREAMEPQLEVAGLKGFADGTVPIPPEDEFRASHLLTFMVISSDEDDNKRGRSRSTSRRPRRDEKPRKEKQTLKKTSSTKDVDSSSGKGRGDGEASCSMVGVVEPTVSLAPEAGEDFQAVAAAVQANPMAVLLDSGSHHLMGTKAVFVDMAPSGSVKHVRGFNGALQLVEGRRTVALQGEAGKRILIPDSSTGADPACVSCVGGKLARRTFPDKGSDAEEALAVVHIDLCGPFRVAAKDGSLYFLLLKDRHTRFVWVVPVAKKSDVLREFEKWLVLVERQTKKSVLMLRYNRGGVFLGKAFTNFVNGKGIVHDLTCSYTPQQNGMAEREMRTVVESVWTMLLHMGVQHHWWHLALRQAVWVRNCLERSTTPPGRTPYQLLTGKKPDLTLARVWHCMVQFMVPEQQQGVKLAPKARWGLHLGVSPESKGWEVLDLTDNKVVASVEVIFYETLSLEVWKATYGPASGWTQAHPPTNTSTATFPLLAEVDEIADEGVEEVLPPPPVLAPPTPVADRPALTPVSTTGDEGSLKASPVAPARGIGGGRRDAMLVEEDVQPSTTGKQQKSSRQGSSRPGSRQGSCR
ncbi:unnamed protein product [Closterium sp. Naga37s-1]|nr:unnamed protein product [Closterium sp. Naga37s-1]